MDRKLVAYIQEFQGFISPGILAVFLFGFFVKSANRWSGAVGLLICPVTFGVLTTDTVEQALERASTSEGNKGFDVAVAALEMVQTQRELAVHLDGPESA